MLRSTGRYCVFAMVCGAMLVAASVAGAGDIKDPNEIIRSLAPIEYLPVHSGIARGPSIDLTIPFALDSAKLKPEAQAQLRALGEALASEKLKDQAIEIAGHTDASGGADYNRSLSERRAAAVAEFLVKTFGFEAGRFRVVGYGEDELKNPLAPRAAENRRVEISVISGRAGKLAATDTSSELAASSRQHMSTISGFDLRREPAAAEAMKEKARRDGSVRVIVALASSDAPLDETGGWQNINDYIRGLQDRALDRLGWVNFNDLIRFDLTPAMAMTVDGNHLDALLSSDAVVEVYEDAQNSFFLNRSGPIVGLESGAEAMRHGKDVSIAVIDSGIDRDHPFLRGKIVAEACFSSQGTTGREILHSVCPSGDRQEIGVGAAQPCAIELGCDHGTHVAGIAAGAGDEFTGVAAAADIVAVQVSTIVVGEMCGEAIICASPLTSNVILALEWIYRNREQYRIAVVNLSLGHGSFPGRCDRSPMRRIFSLLRQAGIAAIAASGNNGFEDSMTAPACLSDVVSVGATTYADTIAPFSNSSAFLDFLAPGATQQPIGRHKGILSSIPGNRFMRIEGTSMAAPHVAGAFAALKAALPAATVVEMIEAVRQSGVTIRDPRNGRDQPRIRVDRAIETLRQLVAARPAEPTEEAKPTPKPEPKTETVTAPDPAPEAKPAPKSENIDGISIERDPAVIGEDGKIEW